VPFQFVDVMLERLPWDCLLPTRLLLCLLRLLHVLARLMLHLPLALELSVLMLVHLLLVTSASLLCLLMLKLRMRL